MDPTNYEHVQQVIENSNGWCYERMINTLVLEDMIDIWESYVQVLEMTSPN